MIKSTQKKNIFEQCNLLMFFDIPTDFDVVNYKKLNSELVNFDRNKLMLHYVNTGYNENKPYKKKHN